MHALKTAGTDVALFGCQWRVYSVRRRRKKIKSRRICNKNYCDLLTAITHTKILVAYFIISDKNWSISGALRQQGLLIISLESYFYVFGRPFVKRFALCYQTVVCLSGLSVTLVYCSQTVRWLKNKLGMEVGLGHIVLDGDPAPPQQKGKQVQNNPQFSVHVDNWLDELRCHLVRR